MSVDLYTMLKARTVILDGAMGTMLQNRGMDSGECPELFGINNPQVLGDIHYLYTEAGSDIIQTNTFGGNRFKLAEYGLEKQVAEINSQAVKIARQSIKGRAFIAASIGPTGKILQPVGDVEFDDLYEAFKEQAVACEKAGADLISIETMTDIGEMRAALIAVKSNTRLPVIAHMTFEDGERTMMGTDPLTALIILEGLQPLAIGANCSGGSRELLPVIETMGKHAGVYLSVEPNAGIPKLIDSKTVFPDTPEDMAEYALRFRDAGANIIGGCCGSTPEHIEAIARTVKGIKPSIRRNTRVRAFASRSRSVLIGAGHPLAFIGERINPTARKPLARDIKDFKMHLVVDEARKQYLSGAPILDVNMGVPGIDEAEAMKKAVMAIQAAVDIPLSIDSSNPTAIEEGLKNFVGRPLINSTTGEEKALDIILPLAKKYGAAVLGLCLDENGIPDSAAGRLTVARKIYQKSQEYGLRNEDIYIDCLVQTASAEQEKAAETLKALQEIKAQLYVGTVLGVSNISYGLPAREILNAAFLAMAWEAGLDLPILNPFEERMMEVTRAAAVLLNRDTNSIEYINRYKDYKPGGSYNGLRHEICKHCNIPSLLQNSKKEADQIPKETGEDKSDSVLEKIKTAVFEGDKDCIENLLLTVLNEEKLNPEEIINKTLIPGIEKAGDYYELKKYFLPQLIMASEAMKKAFAVIEPYLPRDSGRQKGVIVMATVEGDIHDIGKNIVSAMLQNYGYQVIDLGKDVQTGHIVEAVEEEKADIVGLSALMTTTMPKMAEVIKEIKNRGLSCKVMVGGAVLTREYAESIGADAYSEDARSAVLTARELIN